MVKYLKKEIILKNGNIRNYYSKLYKNGKIIKITKKEYINHVGGTNYLFNELNKNVNKLASNINSNSGINSDIIFISWFRNNEEIISKLLEDFDINGKLNNGQVTATTFNDFYKWSMLPVIRYIEKCQKFENKNINVTFSVNIRSNDLRNKLIQNKSLQDKVNEALKSLSERYFDRNIFKEIINLKKLNIDNDTIDLICGLEDSPRKLIDRVIYEKYIPTEETKDDVVVSFFKANDTKIGSERIYIEATGPWHKVTWLETSLMQCVYQAKLEYDLENKKLSKEQWLYGALLRCAYSVAYTHLIQQQKPSFIPALFTNRRTGSQEFNILQNLFFADHFKQFAPPLAGGSVSKSDYYNKHFDKNEYVSLGSSSVESWNILGNLKLPCLNPAGTHAHELQMVISTLFPELDRNGKGLPITQVISHYLYYKLVWERTGNVGPMPMLPDTLGTRAFMRAASYVMIDIINKDSGATQRVPFLSVISSARQDSGKLSDFVKIMKEFGYKGGMMASEIESTHDLLTASKLGYANFGAGGFFGDNEKVWGNPNASMNSMAVKAVRVLCDGRIGYPIKIGDPKIDGETVISNDKLSLDNNLSVDSEDYLLIKSYAQDVRDKSYKSVEGNELIDNIFNINPIPVSSAAGDI